LPSLGNLNAGVNITYDPNPREKISASFSQILENRYGGELAAKPISERLQSESREHSISLGNAEYRLRSNSGFSDAILYVAFQKTSRSHFTGVMPDSLSDIQNYIANPPNGEAQIGFLQGGVQFNRRFQRRGLMKHTLTAGLEWIDEFIRDEIPAYRYQIKQHIVNPSAFVQHVWKPHRLFSFLSGIRVDKHNWINNPVWSPRMGMLYSPSKNTQLRMGYGTGFRAPQAHDNDLHIAFAGGGVSRVQLSPLLREEQSRSFNLSWNHDKANERYIMGYTLDAFFNRLRNPFVLENAGADAFGEIFEKRNGQGAQVQGISAEYRFNFRKKMQWQAGFTVQQSRYDTAVTLISGQSPLKAFARTPNAFGYVYGWVELTKKINVSLDAVYTGSMYVPHFGGAVNFLRDSIVRTAPFLEINTALNYKI
jgi:outer membrane receptor for ferrienterochelin and colicins